jgi:hypothetical protein
MSSPHSLPYLTYLMSYDTGHGRLYDRTRTAFLVNAATLTELAIGGQVGDDRGSPRVLSAQPTGDAVLDDLLTRVAAHRRSWKSWLRHHYRQTLALVETELESAGVITVTRQRFGRRQITVLDPAVVVGLQSRVRDVMSTGHPGGPADTGDHGDTGGARDAALGLLAVTGAVRPVRPTRGGRPGEGHARELAARLDAVASPLGRVIPSLRMTMVAAQGGMGGS